MKHIIWSNYDLEALEADIRSQNPELSEQELSDEAIALNDEYLNDERSNLNIDVDNDIVVLADIGRWNGRFFSAGTLTSRNIGECLRVIADYTTWYIGDDGELRCDAVHHDGTNHYLLRTLKKGVNADDIEFFDDAEKGKKAILEYTESLGPVVCGVYGWDAVA